MGAEIYTPLVSIVIPCLNEEETLAFCVQEAHAALASSAVCGEVLVADNGSIDRSVQNAEENGAQVIHVPDQGYGNALLGGIKAAKGQYIMMGDADGSYDFSELPKFLQKLEAGYDLVMGCRLPKGGGRIEQGAMPWKHRWIGNPTLSFIGRLFFSSQVDDFHCGLRAFRRDAILALNLQTPGMEFASEMVIKASLTGLNITQVPITLRRDQRSRQPHLRSWRDGWRHLRFMLLYAPQWLFIYPGLIQTVLCLACFMILLPGPLHVGSVTFDVNTLLVMGTMALVGYHFLTLGLFIKAYAVVSGLLPGSRLWKRLVAGRVVEWGIATGICIMLLGMVWLGGALLDWKEAGFGPLPYQKSLRMVIPAMLTLGLGVHTVFYGFALAVLGFEK